LSSGTVLRRQASVLLTLIVISGSGLPTLAAEQEDMRQGSSAHAIPKFTSGASPLRFNPVTQTTSANYVMTGPRVYLIFWGSRWNDSTTKDTSSVYTNYQARLLLSNFFSALAGGDWANTLTQYCEGVPQGSASCSGNPSATYISNPTALVMGTWVDTSDPLPGTVDYVAARAEAVAAFNHFADGNGIYMVFTPSGVSWDLFGSDNPCAWHDEADAHAPEITFGIVPYQPDRGFNCGEGAVNPLVFNAASGGYGDGWFDGLTMVTAHEYAEVVTDPFSGGWYDSTG
jgi:hypothetical protein